MNYIVTTNIGDWICNNARSSFTAASQRWDAKFYEITERLSPAQWCGYDKFYVVDKLLELDPDTNGILFTDADTLISSNAPNPFKIFTDPSRVYACSDCHLSRWPVGSAPYEVIKDQVTTPYIVRLEDDLKMGMSREDIDNSVFWCINSGVFIVYARQIQSDLKEFQSIIQKNYIRYDSGHPEQAMFNYFLRLKNKVCLIDHEWNTILSPDPIPEKMNKFVFHFTGITNRIDGTKGAVSTYNWKVE